MVIASLESIIRRGRPRIGRGAGWHVLFSWQAGNLDMLGGLSPQSKTLGQDEMLAHGASAAISDLQLTSVIFVANVVERMLWYWHHDPFNDMRVQMDLDAAPEEETAATREESWRDRPAML